ncbi:hypothetical protein BC567DRAFT_238311 [Phyllosticta citribraziliensis]
MKSGRCRPRGTYLPAGTAPDTCSLNSMVPSAPFLSRPPYRTAHRPHRTRREARYSAAGAAVGWLMLSNSTE